MKNYYILSLIVATLCFGTTVLAGSSKNLEWQEGLVLTEPGEKLFYRVPEVIANLAKGSKNNFVKARITLQLNDRETEKKISDNLPLINNNITEYFHTIAVETIQAPDGPNKIRNDLLTLVNKVIEPKKIKAVLFEQLLTQ